MADKKQNQKEKRNAKGGGSVRQRPDGRWEARCTINGKTRSFYADKQADALKLMRDAQKAVDEQTYVEPSKMTFGEWLDIWVEQFSKPVTKQSSYEIRKMWISTRIIPYLGKIKLQKLTTAHIQQFYKHLLEHEKLSRKTVKTAIHGGIVICSLNKAMQLDYINKNPAQNCALPPPTKKEMCVFDNDEVSLFLKKTKEKEPSPFKELFEVTLFTGMREGEVCGLTWDEVDFGQNCIRIKHQLHLSQKTNARNSAYISTTKNGKERTIFPPSSIMQLLKKVHHQQILDQIAAGAAWKNEKNFVFTNKIGEFILPKTAYARFKKIVSAMGKPNMRFHDLRHTYAVLSLQAGNDIKTLQDSLGHSTAALTLEVYAHATRNMKQQSAENLENFYKKIKA